MPWVWSKKTKKKKKEKKENRNRPPTDTENKPIVTKGGRGKEINQEFGI